MSDFTPADREAVGARQDATNGLDEVNQRFHQHDVGYRYEHCNIVRIDSEYLHAKVVKEALALLDDPMFKVASDEFMTAHGHFREGKLRDCNTAALRAMESTLKAICDARGWSHSPGDTVERLIALVRAKGLFPDYLGGYFDNLIGAMKCGLPKIRDQQGGHGASLADAPVPGSIAG